MDKRGKTAWAGKWKTKGILRKRTRSEAEILPVARRPSRKGGEKNCGMEKQKAVIQTKNGAWPQEGGEKSQLRRENIWRTKGRRREGKE